MEKNQEPRSPTTKQKEYWRLATKEKEYWRLETKEKELWSLVTKEETRTLEAIDGDIKNMDTSNSGGECWRNDGDVAVQMTISNDLENSR